MIRAVNYKGQQYAIIGQIKVNKCIFILAMNNKNLICLPASQLYQGYEQPTEEDVVCISYIQKVLQNEIVNMPNVNYRDVQQRIVSINNDINDRVVNREIIQNYFAPKAEPVQKVNYPAYDEQAVSVILSRQNPGIDMNAFVNHYLYDFTQEQIHMLLNNYNLTQEQRNALSQRIVTETQSSNTNAKANPGKRKTLALPGFAEKKEAAFVDTLLLSFTVGTICGIYLMYFILSIMS